jgi:hypothetical protein
VAFIGSLAVTPPGRLSRARIVSVLLPSRTPFSLAAFSGEPVPLGLAAVLGAFLAGLAFLPDLYFFFATCAPSGATRAFLAAFGFSPVAGDWALPVSSAIDVFMFSLSAVITAVTTWITLVGPESKAILAVEGDGVAMNSRRLAERLKRLESRIAPTSEPVHIRIEYSDANGVAEFEDIWIPPRSEPLEQERSWAAGRKQTQVFPGVLR